jgi:hypothetical protein
MLAYPWSLFFSSGKSCGVQLSTQGLLTPLQVLTGAVNRGHVGGLDMIWLSSPDLGALPKLSSVVLLNFRNTS